ncbi:MAG: hypothetical protein N2Z81_04845 [Hydrogenothermaceae bacterium]|nr:hypothetical protein [Hydrogenothermaceae bacterium]
MNRKRTKNFILYFLVISAFVSISVFEIFVGILLIITLYNLVKRKLSLNGTILKPLSLYSFSTLLTTSLYGSVSKAVEQAIFPFIYLLKDKFEVDYEFFRRLNLLLIFIGLFLSPIALYKYFVLNDYGMLWGGPFEMGMWFSFFALASLSMSIYHFKNDSFKKYLYFVIFLFFVGFVLLSARRNSLIGFGATLAFMIFVYRYLLPKKIILFIVSGFLILSLGFGFYLVNKDSRFRTLYDIFSGKSQLTDETANTIVSGRWQLFQEGVEVIKKDFKDGNYFNILFGHGVGCGNRLQPKAYNGSDYESTIFISEFIIRGVVGLVGILWMMLSYFTYLLRINFVLLEDILVAPSLFMLGCIFVGSLFSGFWDALLPLYLLLFGITESFYHKIKNWQGT